MSLREIFNTLLTVSLVALTQGCETDATELMPDSGSRVAVMTCLAETGREITVHLTASVPYSDTAVYSTVGAADVTLAVNGNIRQSLHLDEGQTSVTFTALAVKAGDELTVEANAPQLNAKLSGHTRMESPTAIEGMDTLTLRDGTTLRITTFLTDDKATTDYYQIEVRSRAYRGGAAKDSVLKCDYLSSAFTDAGGAFGTQSSLIGLFEDTRLIRLANGRSPMTLTTAWDGLTAALRGTPDSATVAVRLYHHTEDYYTFLQTAAQAQRYVFLPVFSTGRVFSNVSGGYGIVSGMAYDEVEMRVSKKWTPNGIVSSSRDGQ